jgi:hypothetical protein
MRLSNPARHRLREMSWGEALRCVLIQTSFYYEFSDGAKTRRCIKNMKNRPDECWWRFPAPIRLNLWSRKPSLRPWGSVTLTSWHDPLKLALTSPTSGGRTVAIVRSRTLTRELVNKIEFWSWAWSYIKTEGQSANLSWCRETLWTLWRFSGPTHDHILTN